MSVSHLKQESRSILDERSVHIFPSNHLHPIHNPTSCSVVMSGLRRRICSQGNKAQPVNISAPTLSLSISRTAGLTGLRLIVNVKSAFAVISLQSNDVGRMTASFTNTHTNTYRCTDKNKGHIVILTLAYLSAILINDI